MKTLLIGGGGREHALAWKLMQSELVSDLICAPGNAGIAQICGCVDIAANDIIGLLALIQREKIDFIVVGPEDPLALGITDMAQDLGIPVFGPSQAAAQLESSKAFMKDFCKRHNIPTAAYDVFTEIKPAKAFLKTLSAPYVIKTDGLAGGKGVAIPETLAEAEAELDAYFDGKFGEAGQRVIIEEFMHGEEASFFAITDGKDCVSLIAAQDHKRVGEGDTGPNTGGMGAYAPAPIFTKEVEGAVRKDIITPTVKGMAEEDIPFCGVLFAGLMITNDGPKLIEYNIRFGDPECQVVMRMLESDLAELLLAAAKGELSKAPAPKFSAAPTANVVMCAKGYPGKYAKGTSIKNLEPAQESQDGVLIFHAGTKYDEEQGLLSNGGRVLNITAQADNLKDALDQAYAAIDQIDWTDGFVRRDIGWRALK